MYIVKLNITGVTREPIKPVKPCALVMERYKRNKQTEIDRFVEEKKQQENSRRERMANKTLTTKIMLKVYAKSNIK